MLADCLYKLYFWKLDLFFLIRSDVDLVFVVLLNSELFLGKKAITHIKPCLFPVVVCFCCSRANPGTPA